jgi:hypothetical protein
MAKEEQISRAGIIHGVECELERLGWTKKQADEKARKKYRKVALCFLTNEEYQDFLNYLESLPSPFNAETPFFL